MTRQPTSYRLSEDTVKLVQALSSQLHVSQTQVVERAVEAFGREQALKQWETLRAWWENIPPESREMLRKVAALQPQQAKAPLKPEGER